MNVTLNIEINTDIPVRDKYELISVMRDQLADYLVEAKLVTTLKKAKTVPVGETELPNKLNKTIHLKLNVPIERGEDGRRKSPTSLAGKYLDKWIDQIQYGHITCGELPTWRQKDIDLATMSIKKYNVKYNSDLPEAFMPGTSYSGIYINPQTRPKT